MMDKAQQQRCCVCCIKLCVLQLCQTVSTEAVPLPGNSVKQSPHLQLPVLLALLWHGLTEQHQSASVCLVDSPSASTKLLLRGLPPPAQTVSSAAPRPSCPQCAAGAESWSLRPRCASAARSSPQPWQPLAPEQHSTSDRSYSVKGLRSGCCTAHTCEHCLIPSSNPSCSRVPKCAHSILGQRRVATADQQCLPAPTK